jgi:hypothetical protein
MTWYVGAFGVGEHGHALWAQAGGGCWWWWCVERESDQLPRARFWALYPPPPPTRPPPLKCCLLSRGFMSSAPGRVALCPSRGPCVASGLLFPPCQLRGAFHTLSEQSRGEGGFDPIDSPRFSLVYMDDPDDLSDDGDGHGDASDGGVGLGLGASLGLPTASGRGRGAAAASTSDGDDNDDDTVEIELAPLNTSGAASGSGRPLNKRVSAHLNTAFDHGSPVSGQEEGEELGEEGEVDDSAVGPEGQFQARLGAFVNLCMGGVVALNLALLAYVW